MRFCSASGLVISFLPLSSWFTLFSGSMEMNTGPLNDILWQLTPKLYEKLLERHFRRTSFASWFRKTHSAGFCCIRGFSSPRHRPCSQHLQRSASQDKAVSSTQQPAASYSHPLFPPRDAVAKCLNSCGTCGISTAQNLQCMVVSGTQKPVSCPSIPPCGFALGAPY